MTILCLGSEVILSITTKIENDMDGWSTGDEIGYPAACRNLRSLYTDQNPASHIAPESAESGSDSESEMAAENQILDRTTIRRRTHAGLKFSPRKRVKRWERTLVVTMVHGDILMLSGGDFEVG
jgi:hypothetical protein